MALNFHELAHSRPVERAIPSASVTLKWIALYSYDEKAVYTGLQLVAPTRWDGLRRSKITLDPQGGGVWFGSVEYAWTAQTQGSPDAPPNPAGGDPLGPEWSFDGTAADVHITQSIKTVSKTARPGVFPGNVAPNYKQAIGVTQDRVEGVDIKTPKLEISLTLTFPFLTLDRIRIWSLLAGRTNVAPFATFQAGELLYLGPPVSIQPGQLCKVTHKFVGGKNLTLPKDKADLTIVPESAPRANDGLILPAKRAFDYVWCAYADEVNPGKLVQTPVAAYVEQVYREADFNHLLLGA